MGKLRFRWVGPLVAVAIVAGAATGFAQLSDNFTSRTAPVPGPAPATWLVTQSPSIMGGGGPGHNGEIQVIALDFGLTPGGTAGLCTGLNFRKPTDQATPQLFNAAAVNTTIGTATFTEYRPGPTAKSTQPTLRITASSSLVTSIHHVTATTTGAYDDVTLQPTRVTIAWLPSGRKTQISCAH